MIVKMNMLLNWVADEEEGAREKRRERNLDQRINSERDNKDGSVWFTCRRCWGQ